MSFKKFSTDHDTNNKADTDRAGKTADIQTVLQPVAAPEPAPVALSAPSKP